MPGQDAWMPPKGRHPVTIGGSLTRVLKARKGQPTKPSRNIPVKDFYLFKYGFKPESVDSAKPGMLEVRQGKDKPSVRVERASFKADEIHVFQGKADTAKEIECVLIYNEAEGVFTLEKLDSSVSLTHEGKTQAQAKAQHLPASQLPVASRGSSTLSVEQEQDELHRQLERDLLDSNTDADGDYIENDVEEPMPWTSAASSKVDMKKPSTPQSTIYSSFNNRGAKVPREVLSTNDVEEEDLQFGQPSKVVRKQTEKVSPSTQPHISLPTQALAAPLVVALPSRGVANTDVAQMPLSTNSDHSESGDDWIDAMRDDGSFGGKDTVDGEDDLGEEIDENLFAAELDRELLGEDDDAEDDMEAVFPDNMSTGALQVGRPMSPSQFAAVQLEQDDDDYSSSDDSDDE